MLTIHGPGILLCALTFLSLKSENWLVKSAFQAASKAHALRGGAWEKSCEVKKAANGAMTNAASHGGRSWNA
jgi:hypothetical protein